ncbi:penicillin acylase family protein [Sabulicella rubraurantiaca]|uniref:penicillin acylase family protein n=1 Tax=Sabulicella rubraurantiaca TaxID=2811429 RepID=UPI001A958BEC|nr:penicillin acylase family protein [Sabulicella rubraurantiaca]
MPRRWRRRGWRWGRALLLVLLILAAIPLGLLWITLPGSMSRLEDPALSAPIAIQFDAGGMPTIRAATEADAAFAMGWLHARDRMFQMEMMRRGAEGRLAEILGEPALRVDRMSRTLGLAQRAEADLVALDADTRDVLQRYADGVNARIAERGRLIAPEFLLLGAPEPWRPMHTLLWAKVMGLWLSGNWRTELERAALAARLPAERLWDLWPADRTAGRPDIATLPGAARALAAIPVFGVDAPLPERASNAWAVARGAGGAPLLASDPHLGYGAPVLWYLARIELPDDTRLGATSPGVPFMVIGRNRDLAWGFTTTHSDTQDVFLGGAVVREREELIRIRGRRQEVLRVRETQHGPVVGEAPPMSVRMANLEPGDTAAAGLLALNRARDLAGARAAAALISSPPQNLMVAVRDGGIAMFLVGRTPLRTSGHDGSVPWDGPGWEGFVNFDAMPHRENPASGVLVNANNKVQPDGHPVFLGREWYGDWRFRRIHALLAEDAPQDISRMAAIQRDVVSLPAREALSMLNALPRSDGMLGRAQALLADWDGTMAAERPEPLIWAEFNRRFRAAALRRTGVPDAPAGTEFGHFLLTAPEASWWCGGDCRALAGITLAEAVIALQAAHGPDPASWRWGQAHLARFEHPVLRFVPLLSRWTRLEAPVGGDGDTVRREAVRGDGYISMHGAGLRFVADLSTPDGAFLEIATGQSGHPMSRHWGDRLRSWAR